MRALLLLLVLALGGCGPAVRFPSIPVPAPSVPEGDPPGQEPPAQLRGYLAQGDTACVTYCE